MRTERVRHRCLLVMYLFTAGIIVCGKSSAGADKQSPPRTSTFEFKFFDGNQINCTINSSGPFADYLRTGQAGLEWPKGSGKTAVFTSGIWLIGRHAPSGQLRTAVQDYHTEYQPGPILSTFNTTTNDKSAAGDPTDPRYRIYKINRTDTVGGVNPDYDEWPADLGAPVDVEGKPLFSGDQQLWVVYNDADPAAHQNTGVTPPMGLEVQPLYYGFNRSGVLANTMFIRWLIINKSDARYEDTYFAMWSDPDLGDANDDFLGSDSLLSLVFVYNADNFDGTSYGYRDKPPALGYLLLQGPIVPSTPMDSARFRGKIIKGKRNLPMTATSFFIGGDLRFTDPPLGGTLFAQIAHRYLQGLQGETGYPYANPVTGQPTSFIFSGDPITGSGWLPAVSQVRSGDLRFLVSSGPFTLAPGDTQEVVSAVFLSQGPDRLASVRKLKEESLLLRTYYESAEVSGGVGPTVTHSVQFVSPSETRVDFGLSAAGAENVILRVHDYDFVPVDSVVLFDDGVHGDGEAGDDLFGAAWVTAPRPMGLLVDAEIDYETVSNVVWYDLIGPITTAGPMTVVSPSLVSDNINSDGRINPGENVRYVFSLNNETPFTMTGVNVEATGVDRSDLVVRSGEVFTIAELASGATASLVYDETDPSSYFSLDVPSGANPGPFTLSLSITDDSYNEWDQSIGFEIQSIANEPIFNVTSHDRGNSEGVFGVMIVDPSVLKNHTYEMSVVDSITATGELGFTLVDLVDGRVVLENHPLPDVYSHNVPVTDGFKVTKGTAMYEAEYPGPKAKDWSYSPPENRFITGKKTPEPMDTFFGGVAFPRSQTYLTKRVSVHGDSLKQVAVIFSAQQQQKAYRYLSRVSSGFPLVDTSFASHVLNRGTGFVYQDFVDVPFTVWEVDPFDGDATPRQLNAAFLEHNDSLYSPTGAFRGRGRIDGQWFPTTADNGAKEVIYIFTSTYSPEANSFYTQRNLFLDQEEMDILFVLWPRLDESLPQMFADGDVFTIYPQYPPVRPGNVYSFNPVLLEVKPEPKLAVSFALYQNYPNPFNPATTIEYELPKEIRVTLKIFDILGREVVTLVDGVRSAGRHVVRWEGANNLSRLVSSGVYLYRLQAGEWTRVRKMVMIR